MPSQWAGRRQRQCVRIAALFVVSVMVVVGLVAVVAHRRSEGADPSTAGTPGPSPTELRNSAPASETTSPATGAKSAAPLNPLTMTAAFARLTASVDAVIGLAVAPIGRSEDVIQLGQWVFGPAWSTAKVPVVLAAVSEQSTPTLTSAMEAAIVRSDNNAAEE